MSVNNPLFIYIFINNSVILYTGVKGKSVNKQRIVCDKIAEVYLVVGQFIQLTVCSSGDLCFFEILVFSPILFRAQEFNLIVQFLAIAYVLLLKEESWDINVTFPENFGVYTLIHASIQQR